MKLTPAARCEIKLFNFKSIFGNASATVFLFVT